MQQLNESYGYNSSEGKWSKKKILIVIAVLLVVFYFSKSGDLNTESRNFNTQDNISLSREIKYTDYYDSDKNDSDIPFIMPDVNECGYDNYGFPDLDGTEREGDTCKDYISSERDMACLSNPPVDYVGEINLLEKWSVPALKCCVDDGTCYWGDKITVD